MIQLVKILLFGIVNAAGFTALPILANVAIMLNMHPKFSSAIEQEHFKFYFFGIGTWVWIAAAVLSLGYFFAKSAETRFLLILAPLFAPIIYGVGLMVYAHYSNTL